MSTPYEQQLAQLLQNINEIVSYAPELWNGLVQYTFYDSIFSLLLTFVLVIVCLFTFKKYLLYVHQLNKQPDKDIICGIYVIFGLCFYIVCAAFIMLNVFSTNNWMGLFSPEYVTVKKMVMQTIK